MINKVWYFASPWLILTIFLLVIPNVLSAAEVKTEKQVETITRKCLESIGSGNIDQFISTIEPVWPYSDEELISAKEKVIQKRETNHEKYGKSLGLQHISTDLVADTVMRILYLEKFEKHAVVWKFFYYKPREAWFLNTFSWDGKLHDLFTTR